MSLPGPLIEPGDSALVEILVDISPNAPEGFLELMVFETGIRAVDSNLNLPTTITTYSGSEFPLASGLTRLVPPARELVADLKDRMPAALAADGNEVRVAVLTLQNTAASNSDSIYVSRLTLRAMTAHSPHCRSAPRQQQSSRRWPDRSGPRAEP